MNISNQQMDLNFLESCNICGEYIVDLDIMHIENCSYHAKCLVCGVCGRQLEGRCFNSYGTLYCCDDFMRIHGTHCVSCGELIASDEIIYTIGPNTNIHAKCFNCTSCRRQIQHGEIFRRSSNEILCQTCNASRVQYHPQIQQTLPTTMLGIHSMQRRKRARTVLTAQQRHLFRRTFEDNPKPSRRLREQLATETGLTSRVIQVWFQNERAKMKRDRTVQG